MVGRTFSLLSLLCRLTSSSLEIEEGLITLPERNVARSAESGQQEASTLRLSEGTELIGEYEGSGFKERVYLARREDGQVMRFSRLLYLVATEADGQKDLDQIARRVSEKFGRAVSADNVRVLVEEKLRPLGVLAPAGSTSHQPAKLPRAKPVLALHWGAPILSAGGDFLAKVPEPRTWAEGVGGVISCVNCRY